VDPVLARLGLPPLHSASPLSGYLLIADRDNNRIIIVDPAGRIMWRFPSGGGSGFARPDDAFVSPDARYISVNQEFNETIALVSLSRDPRIVSSCGHQAVRGAPPATSPTPMMPTCCRMARSRSPTSSTAGFSGSTAPSGSFG